MPDEYLAGALGNEHWYSIMMSVIGLSLPEIIILKKVLKWQLIAVFIGVVAGGIIIVGFIFNYLVFIYIFHFIDFAYIEYTHCLQSLTLCSTP